MTFFSRFLLVALLVPLACCAWAEPVTYTVDQAHSVFAVVTHKAGLAARLAHNHFIAPKTYICEINGESGSIEGLSFLLKFPVSELAADIPETQETWFKEIRKAGILEELFSEVSESDRATIEKHMRAEGQLDAERFPEIEVELVSTQSITSIESIKSKQGEKTFERAATIRFAAHGKTVERAVPANVTLSNGALNVEAVGQFRFTEFGIEPYSAFLGAVKNQDEFDVYVCIQAQATLNGEQGK